MAVVSVCKAELPSVAGATEMGISGCVVGGGAVVGGAEVMGTAVDMVAEVEGPAAVCPDIVESDTRLLGLMYLRLYSWVTRGRGVPASAARLQRRPGGRRPARPRSVLQRGSWTQEAREIRLISKLTSLTFSTCFCSHMTTADYRIQMQK